MQLHSPITFSASKSGNGPQDNEDAFRVAYPHRIEGDKKARIVVADGASESAFASQWANCLVEAFVQNPLLDAPSAEGRAIDEWDEWMQAPAAKWHAWVPWDRIPWHGESKAKAGAMSALMGVTIQADGSRNLSWRAVSIGDCCLFIVRDDSLALSFPIDHSSQFDNTPPLLCSNRDNNKQLVSDAKSGECHTGDWFFLLSDSVAGWFLAEWEAKRRPWDELLSQGSEGERTRWLAAQREQRKMRNDDSTFVAIQVR